MRKRPLTLVLCACLFLYLPVSYTYRIWTGTGSLNVTDIVLWGICPVALLVGLLRVTKVGWYTLVALIALWGVVDLREYYASQGASLSALIVHLTIYALSMGYFINPRIRHLYFDPRLRWWRTKPRFETHMPFIFKHESHWHYPILGNISEGGCFVETSRLLNINEDIRIHIPLPVPLNVSVIKTTGVVRWISNNPLRCGMGIQFKDLPTEQAKAIRTFVQKEL